MVKMIPSIKKMKPAENKVIGFTMEKIDLIEVTLQMGKLKKVRTRTIAKKGCGSSTIEMGKHPN